MTYPEEVREAFGWYGAAMHNSQFLEGDLITLQLVASALAGEAATEVELRGLEFALTRRTLGQLLTHLQAAITVPEHDRELWQQVLDLRNRLAHGFFWQNQQRLTSVQGCRTVADELRQAALAFDEASQRARALLEQCITKLGIDGAVWKAQVNAEFARLFRVDPT